MGSEFRLLGSVDATVDGQAVDVGSGRQRVVLVALLVDANQVVTADQLVWRVWGDDPPPRARGTLYSYLSRLRRVLAGVRIERQSGGYRLITDPATVDLHRFGHLVGRARDSDDDRHTAARFEQALQLWRGEAFAAVDSPWIDQVRTGLDIERYCVELDYNDVKLRLGGHADLLGALATRTRERPLDERLAGQLMVALSRSGRQSEALDVYRRTRDLLVGEFGTEPGAELRHLLQVVLRGEAAPRSHQPVRGLCKVLPGPLTTVGPPG